LSKKVQSPISPKWSESKTAVTNIPIQNTQFSAHLKQTLSLIHHIIKPQARTQKKGSHNTQKGPFFIQKRTIHDQHSRRTRKTYHNSSTEPSQNQSHKPADTKPTTHTRLRHHSSQITITVTPNQHRIAHDGTHRELTQKHAQIHRRIGPGNQSRHNTQPCSNGQSTNTHNSTVESKANKVTRSFFLCF